MKDAKIAQVPQAPEVEEEITPTTPQETDPSAALTVAGPQQALAPLTNGDSLFDDIATRRMWHNSPKGDKLAALSVVAAIDDTTYKIGDCIGQVIDVVNIVAHETSISQPDGGAVLAIRTVLIDQAGMSYGSVAEGVRDSVAQLFALVGLPPYSDPIRLTPVNKTTRAGFKTLKLVPYIPKA